MKKIFLLSLALHLIIINCLPAQVKLPAPSPTQTIKQEFGLGSIQVVYSRPGAKGRKVFGNLVPYNKLWRTGANEATRITFSDPVEINGKRLDSGTYALYTIPGEESWQVIFNKGISNWGTEGYKETEDVASFKTEPLKANTKYERFTIQFADVQPESCELQLMWEKKLVVIPITVNIKEKIRAQINAGMLTDIKPYWAAAQFYYEYDKNLTRALENINKAAATNPNAYWMFLYKAKIQQEMGDNAGAKQSAQTSLALSKTAKNEDYVLMNQKLLKELQKTK